MAARKKQQHIEMAYEDYQRTADDIRKELEKETVARGKALMDNEKLLIELAEWKEKVHSERETRMQAERQLEEQVTQNVSVASGGDGGGAKSQLSATIPSDLAASGGSEFRGMHVTELEWEGKDLSGKFTGWIDPDNNNPNGHGTLRMEDESVYDGEWRMGEWQGNGTVMLLVVVVCLSFCLALAKPIGVLSITGKGVYTTVDGDLYSGTWRDGKQHGRGVYVWADGCIYTGDYVDGNRSGKG